MTNLHIAIQMDPIDEVDINGDTSFRLALEAQRREHLVHVYRPEDLSWEEGVVSAKVQAVTLRDVVGNHVTIGPSKTTPLEIFDVILMRQDPPFDMAYITATHLLEQLPKTTQVINNPREVRNAPEKLLVTNFLDLMPPTLISSDLEKIMSFRAKYKDIIIKPLYGNGGQGVFHILPEDENLNSILEMFFSQNKEPLMIQEYLKDVRNGDKRIILLNGEAVGAINRIPKLGESRSNMHAGGKPEKTILTERDKFICNEISQSLVKKGLYFVGIDIIGDYITEINVTSPTGIMEIRMYLIFMFIF